MAINMAKALFVKLLADEKLREAFAKVKTAEEFEELAKKYGYTCKFDEFSKVKEEGVADGIELDAETLAQAAGGLSMVGVDYAFTAVKCS